MDYKYILLLSVVVALISVGVFVFVKKYWPKSNKNKEEKKEENKEETRKSPPYLGFYKSNTYDSKDAFKITEILKKTNGLEMIKLDTWHRGKKNIKYYEKVFDHMSKNNISLVLDVGSGEIDRGWIEPGKNNDGIEYATIFNVKKLLDEKFPGLLIGVMLLDEPIMNLNSYWVNEWEPSITKWKPLEHKIYPKNDLYDNTKYSNMYISNTGKNTEPNTVSSQSDLYALLCTDFKLIRDVFGPDIYYLATFAYPVKDWETKRFALNGDLSNLKNKGDNWKINYISYEQFLHDNPFINVFGMDVYSTGNENIGRFNVWKRGYDVLVKIAKKQNKMNMLILQSNSELIFNVDSQTKNTCDSEREKQVKEYNEMLLKYAKDNGGVEAFPFRLVFMAPQIKCGTENNSNKCGDSVCFANSSNIKMITERHLSPSN